MVKSEYRAFQTFTRLVKIVTRVLRQVSPAARLLLSFSNYNEIVWINEATATAKSLQLCPTLCDPIDGSHQAPLCLGFSRQEHWSGLPFPSPMHESEK